LVLTSLTSMNMALILKLESLLENRKGLSNV
jgi:hypothetical protein